MYLFEAQELFKTYSHKLQVRRVVIDVSSLILLRVRASERAPLSILLFQN